MTKLSVIVPFIYKYNEVRATGITAGLAYIKSWKFMLVKTYVEKDH
jgi:hypothetical protein